MAAHKRLHDGFEQDPDQPEKKRMERSVSFSTVIREAMVMKQVQSVFLVLEPLLRRVVQEEIQAGLVRSPRYIERSSPETPRATEPPAWRLAFLCPPALPIFTGSKIEDVNGQPLQVILVEADTGSPCGALPQFMRVELVPLLGEFPSDGREDWTAGEFARGVVKERAGKRPLLTGDVGLTMRDGRAVVNDLQFTDNSSWVRCRKFRIGARVVPGSYDGARVAEAMTEAFNVRDHRGELYRKHYPPALTDDVWRLEKIGKEGAFHRKLRQHRVETVQEFLRMLMVKPDALRAIMGDGMTDRMWEVTTSHAKTCDAGDKVYAYAGQHGTTVYVNSICQLVKIEFAGVECVAQQLSRDQKAYVHQLYVEAFEQWESLQEAEPATMLHASSSSSNSLPVLHNTVPETPPAAERPVWRLAFLNPPMLPIFTGSKIEDVNGEPLQLILVDADTGSPCGALPQFMRVELVPLFGDFPPGGREEWTAGEFARGVVKERAGKRPLLTGDVNLTMRDGRAVVNELQFTDNSTWVRCRKFRIGARVVPGIYEGARVAEAMTDAFNVRDHRGELYRKHYPPALSDDVWRLEKIGKEGAFHRKLRQHGVETVQEFLRVLMVKPDALHAIMGDGMTDRMWEVITTHAKTCDAGDKVYAYAGQHGATVYVNSICQLVKVEFAGVECAAQQLSRDQKAYVHRLYVEAFEQRENLQEATVLLHASSSSSRRRLPVLHNTAVGIKHDETMSDSDSD